MSLIHEIEAQQMKKEKGKVRTGDQVKVFFKVIEGANERIQPFEGTVIRKRGAGTGETFTVRKTSFGVGIERIFPINSPRIEKIETVRKGRVRRSRLYYLRALAGKAARIEEAQQK